MLFAWRGLPRLHRLLRLWRWEKAAACHRTPQELAGQRTVGADRSAPGSVFGERCCDPRCGMLSGNSCDPGCLRLVVGLLQRGDVDFFHLQHGLADSFGFLGVVVLQHLGEHFGDDLPDEAEFVFDPAAVERFAAGGEFVPEVVYFLLSFAINQEGYGGIEGVVRAAIERAEFLAIENEGGDENFAAGKLAGFS